MKKLLGRPILRLYLLYRGSVGSEKLKQLTLAQIENFQNKLKSLSPEQLQTRTSPGKWNAGEIAFHTLGGARSILKKCELLRKGELAPDLERSGMGRTKEIPYEELLALGKKVHEMASQFDFHSPATATSRHPLFGPLNFKGWLVMNLIHLERHYQQLARTV